MTERRVGARLPLAVFGACALLLTLLLPPLFPRDALYDELGAPECSGDAPINVNVSTEKVALVAALAREYNAASRCGRVRVDGTSSGLAMRQLADGWSSDEVEDAPEPQVWLPTSSLWVGQLEERGRPDVVRQQRSPVATSYLTLAMPKQLADPLRARFGAPSWADVRTLAEKGWAAVDKAEYGRFKLGRDDPEISTSGMAATLALYHAAAERNGVALTEKNLRADAVLDFVRDIESSVDRYGSDATQYMQLLYDQDKQNPTIPYVSGLIVQEQLAYCFNAGAPTCEPADLRTTEPGEGPSANGRLVAVYPSEGSVELDHPFLVLSSASAAQRETAADFNAFLTAPKQRERFVEIGFRGPDGRATPRLQQSLGITDARPPVVGDLPSPRVVSEMLMQWKRISRPARVLLLIDASGSMNGASGVPGKTRLDLVKAAVRTGVASLQDKDEVEVWDFGGDAKPPITQLLGRSSLAASRETLNATIGALRTATDRGRGTALYDAVLAARRTVQDSYNPERINAVVVISDGRQEPQVAGAKEQLLTELQADRTDRPVPVYTVPFGAAADARAMSEIATASNAVSFPANPDDISQVFVSLFTTF